jgi:hypothetical protein
MAGRPENIERPNSSEVSPRKTRNPKTVKKLGSTAIRGKNKK